MIFINKKSIFIIALLVNYAFACCNASGNDSINIERFIYYTADSIPIESTLYLPKKEIKSLLIQLHTTHLNYRHPDFTSVSDSIRFEDILILTSEGHGVVLISPRYKYTPENLPKLKNQTYRTLADDAETARLFLKKDARFTRIPIGVYGASATGIAAAKLASRTGAVDFAMLVSTPGTPGTEDLYFKWDTDMKESAKYMYLMFFNEFRRFFPENRFVYQDSLYTDTDPVRLDRKFVACVWDCIREINSTVLMHHNDIASIHRFAQKQLKEAFQTDTIKKEIVTAMVSASKSTDINRFIDLFINSALYAPLDVDYLKWDPEACYPEIDCPVLMLFGEKDINIDIKKSIENSKRIVKSYRKTNFSIVVIPDVDHSFYVPDETITFRENGRSYTLNKQSDSYFQSMSGWLDSLPTQ